MPTISPDPGFYSQYITVTLKASNGTLYVNPNGQYPSIHTDKYTGPVTLTEGENTIYAIAVSPEGLVSPLAIYGYTLGGIVEIVNFADPAIESQVRNTLGVPESTTLYTNDLWDITEFVIPFTTRKLFDILKNTDCIYAPVAQLDRVLDSDVSGQFRRAKAQSLANSGL